MTHPPSPFNEDCFRKNDAMHVTLINMSVRTTKASADARYSGVRNRCSSRSRAAPASSSKRATPTSTARLFIAAHTKLALLFRPKLALKRCDKTTLPINRMPANEILIGSTVLPDRGWPARDARPLVISHWWFPL